ncbi:CrcB protein [Bacillus mesophilus]|uniref:Fluoride-specific ion channel FluC n=1 Tax=Bacillus mesophilus TaxID=1808955 RepID=A0A6M0Q2C2_9BACI|nr:CrcB family protein [Bacillus mesophilus]MBM7659565.1 CrcB protein [Bacillus mesophilus]NEY70436.1 CrcB family protein [Bacillus mesophilus]
MSYLKKNKWISVGVGGFLGAGSRYAIYMGFPDALSLYGTFLCNMLGCLIIGFLFDTLKNKPFHRELWLLFGTGFCGGFTTMSAFASEIVHLGSNNLYLLAACYLLGTWVFGIVLTIIGVKASQFLSQRLERRSEN